MVPKSIRLRLPLSYAGIALLTVLALGVVLLTRLQRYYLEQELAYLKASVQGISPMLALTRQQDVPLSPLHAQLNSIAYFAQVRVQLLDAQGGVIVDSNDPNMLAVYFVSEQFTRVWEGGGGGAGARITLRLPVDTARPTHG